MTLTELGIILDQKMNFEMLDVDRGTGVRVRFRRLETKERKDSGCLTSVSGDGDTKKEALADYAAQLCGKWIVIDAYGKARREFQLPPVITP